MSLAVSGKAGISGVAHLRSGRLVILRLMPGRTGCARLPTGPRHGGRACRHAATEDDDRRISDDESIDSNVPTSGDAPLDRDSSQKVNGWSRVSLRSLVAGRRSPVAGRTSSAIPHSSFLGPWPVMPHCSSGSSPHRTHHATTHRAAADSKDAGFIYDGESSVQTVSARAMYLPTVCADCPDPRKYLP